MEKLRHGPVLHLGVKGLDDDDDDIFIQAIPFIVPLILRIDIILGTINAMLFGY
jgi:hypothetical protein